MIDKIVFLRLGKARTFEGTELSMSRIMATLGYLNQFPWADQLPELLGSGKVDAVRINVTRWNEEQIRGAIQVLRQVRPETKILIDLGQKLRVRTPNDQKMYFEEVGQIFTIALAPTEGDLCFRRDISDTVFAIGDPVMMRDGKSRGRVKGINPTHLVVELTYFEEGEGYLNVFSGITLPNTRIKRAVYEERELEMIRLAAELDVDMIASSFIESPDDVTELLEALGDWRPIVVPKIESRRGVDSIDDILQALPADRRLVMIARGDLFVEVGPRKFGSAQHQIARACKYRYTPYILATGVLRSMRTMTEPARAEVSDVFYGVREGATYLMTAEETNNSPHPVTVVEMLHAIIQDALS